MILTKEQTFEHLVTKFKSKQKRYKTTTKFRWKCLKCLKPIYIRHTNISLASIFCDECLPLCRNKPTIAQYHYLRKMKEAQMQFIDKKINNWINGEQNESNNT